MKRIASSFTTVILILSSSAQCRLGADEPPGQAATALARFQQSWQELPTGQYMRPRDDAGWKARMRALCELARAGAEATEVLEKGLTADDAATRVFAAQALALLVHPRAKDMLVTALDDRNPVVRLYALDALSMFGKLPDADPYRMLRQKDPNRDVRSHAAFAIERDDVPQPDAISRALQDYDTKVLATARLGEQAPDFTLTSVAGKPVRLSDYRDKEPVVLIFIYGDT